MLPFYMAAHTTRHIVSLYLSRWERDRALPLFATTVVRTALDGSPRVARHVLIGGPARLHLTFSVERCRA